MDAIKKDIFVLNMIFVILISTQTFYFCANLLINTHEKSTKLFNGIICIASNKLWR